MPAEKLTATYMVGLLGYWRFYKDNMYFPSLLVFLLGLRLDAQAAMEYLLRCQDIDRRKIVLFGRSLGGAVAIDLASNTTYSDKCVCL